MKDNTVGHRQNSNQGQDYMLRRFHFERKKDISGVSGCGKVAEGVLFTDGSCVLHWAGEHSSTNVYKSIDDLLFVHGHNGCTKIIWDDPAVEEMSQSKRKKAS